MASRRSRQRQTAEAARWIAWADVPDDEIDTEDRVEQDDVFDGEQYEDPALRLGE